MDAVAALTRLGGVGSTGEIVALSSRRQLRSAVRRGEVHRVARGGYALPGTARGLERARRHSSVLSHLSAAQHHGWAVKTPPHRTWLTVPRNRKIASELAATAYVAYADLPVSEVDRGTTPLRTVLDSARRLPLDEALAVADSAVVRALGPARRRRRGGLTALTPRSASPRG